MVERTRLAGHAFGSTVRDRFGERLCLCDSFLERNTTFAAATAEHSLPSEHQQQLLVEHDHARNAEHDSHGG